MIETEDVIRGLTKLFSFIALSQIIKRCNTIKVNSVLELMSFGLISVWCFV